MNFVRRLVSRLVHQHQQCGASLSQIPQGYVVVQYGVAKVLYRMRPEENLTDKEGVVSAFDPRTSVEIIGLYALAHRTICALGKEEE